MQNAAKHLLLATAIGIAFAMPMAANANCWAEASSTYGMPVEVLKAVAKTESNFNPNAIHKNNDASFDIGMMQINSKWLPTLNQYGITQASLKDACTNLKVGAWILANNAKRLGWNWNAIGAYNVGCANLAQGECDKRRNAYAWKIHTALRTVTTLSDPAGLISTASYESGATSASNTVIRSRTEQPVNQPKIMNLQIASVEASRVMGRDQRSVETEDAMPGSLALNVGAFLNYQDDGADHE